MRSRCQVAIIRSRCQVEIMRSRCQVTIMRKPMALLAITGNALHIMRRVHYLPRHARNRIAFTVKSNRTTVGISPRRFTLKWFLIDWQSVLSSRSPMHFTPTWLSRQLGQYLGLWGTTGARSPGCRPKIKNFKNFKKTHMKIKNWLPPNQELPASNQEF